MLMVNVVGTYAVSKAFLPLLRKGTKKVIVNISSDAGCHAQNASFIHSKKPSEGGVGLSYRTSKPALNMGECPDSHFSMFQQACPGIHTNPHVHLNQCNRQFARSNLHNAPAELNP